MNLAFQECGVYSKPREDAPDDGPQAAGHQQGLHPGMHCLRIISAIANVFIEQANKSPAIIEKRMYSKLSWINFI